MYLKNVSDDAYVMVHTVVGKIGMLPGEVIQLNEKLLPPISKYMKQVTEQEYLDYKQAKKTEDVVDDIPPAPDTTIDDNDLEIVDDNAESFIDSLLSAGMVNEQETNQPTEVPIKEDVTKTEDVAKELSAELQVQKTESSDEIALLQQQIDDLQQTWLVTKQAKKKEKIQKDIIKLQKQLKKLQEN